MLTALIPIKEHSERVPGKNLRSFAGRPLYQVMFSTLQECDCISEIIVNTDCSEIMEFASTLSKAKAVVRPEELRGDMITMNTLIAHDITQTNADHFFQTHCTNPLLTKRTIEKAASLYLDSLHRYDSVYSVNRIQARVYDKDDVPVNHSLSNMLRTQDLDPVFEENSNFFIFSRSSFGQAGMSRIGNKPLRYEMSRIEAIDIDHPENFLLAELVYSNRDRFGL